ncbi:MAG: winged helix-turn-helix transcriptional regulator [Candidatus Aenigmarchaeota archaeon]|nr:winged helix-turn-helix transcriptional regulator [Candidatus Aenigmarchaeota archaeon]NIQ17536.1 winged helix-turn-helix transcriptional regulator [Candidatus Aenigmarchaeota archaeon]NIS73114.1 winged helix-turn-helix transcriptional regulator [Candidatus Aenigmarchaeota archaeon]
MVKNRGLTNTERLVMGRLEMDARTSLSRIGKSVRKSQQIVSYTVNSLVEKEIIRGFYTIVDYSRMDMLNFRVHFRAKYLGDRNFSELIDYLVSEKHTSWIATRGGGHDVVCSFLTPNPSKFNKIWKGIIEKFPEQIQKYVILTTIVNIDYGRKYLFNDNPKIPQKIYGGDKEPVEIDETDMRILKDLSENARMNSVELANKLSITPKTVIGRIKKLIKEEIILGFRPSVLARNMNHVSSLFLIKYHNVSLGGDEFITYISKHPSIVRAVKTIGEWDMELQVESENVAELRNVEMEIREKFATLIKDLYSVPLYMTYKKTFFPGFLAD